MISSPNVVNAILTIVFLICLYLSWRIVRKMTENMIMKVSSYMLWIIGIAILMAGGIMTVLDKIGLLTWPIK